MDDNKNGHEGKKHRKGKPPVIIPSKVSRWIKENSTNTFVNNWKVGGGHDPWNK